MDNDRIIYPGKKSHPGYHALRERKNALAKFIKMLRDDKVLIDLLPSMRQSLIDNLSNEYRCMHLAHRYLRGRTYRGTEAKTHQPLPNSMIDLIKFQVTLAGKGLCTMPPVEEWVKVN